MHRYPQWGWVLPMLVSAVGAGLAIRMVRNIAPEAAGSRIPHLKAIVLRPRFMAWQRILPRRVHPPELT
jgi:H+/Cl- antiporter ClcA